MHLNLRVSRVAALLLPLGLGVAAGCDTATGPVVQPRDTDAEPLAARSAVQPEKTVAFVNRASFQRLGTETITCTAIPVSRYYDGDGVMSHVGRVSTLATWQSCAFVGSPLPMVATGNAVSVTPSGDELHFTFVQTFTHLVPNDTSAFTITVEITGGTGRFADASGSGAGAGWTKGPDLAGAWTIEGTLTTPRRNQ